MNRQHDLDRVLKSCIVAVIRAQRGDALCDVASALAEGGVDIVEITFTVPNAVQVIAEVADRLGPGVLVGAGTVTSSEMARTALDAGARFIVSPVVDLDVIKTAREADCLVMPGALTPTEVLTAWKAGADIVKVFPADVAGPAYLKALHGPLPEVRLMPTGGVNLQTAADFLQAGACALGVGGALVSAADVAAGNLAEIKSRARQYADIVQTFRGE